MTTKKMMMTLPEIDQAIKQKINASQTIWVISHIRPDSDAIGAVLGLGLALEKHGKTVQMILEDGVPRNHRSLPGSQKVLAAPTLQPDMVIILDCSDPKRTGRISHVLPQPDLVVDHHKTNLNFALHNLVDAQAVSTTAVLYQHMPAWGLEIDQPVAENLLAGLIGDTIGFRTSNTTAAALRMAAELMEKGVDFARIYQEIITNRSYSAVCYWGQGLSKLQKEHQLVWTELTLEDRKKIGYSGNDDADLINVLSSIEEADVAIIFVEQNYDHVKVSWRARTGIDVSAIAFQFGGGGHAAAAGADISGSLAEVKAQVIQKTQGLLMGKHSAH